MIEFSYVDFFTVILQFYKIIHCYFYIQFIISTTNLLSKIPGIKLLVGHMQKSDNEKYERIIKKRKIYVEIKMTEVFYIFMSNNRTIHFM